MRKRWKEVGLGMLNLLTIVLVIALLQPVLRRSLQTDEQKAEACGRTRMIALTSAKLTAEQVSTIHGLHAQGMLLREIAARFGVHIMTVSDMVEVKHCDQLLSGHKRHCGMKVAA